VQYFKYRLEKAKENLASAVIHESACLVGVDSLVYAFKVPALDNTGKASVKSG